MNKKFNYILLCALMACFFINGQDKKSKKADADFNSFAYAGAIDSYENLVEKGYTSEEIFKNLGDANYQNANYGAASDWYAKLFDLGREENEPEYLYKYAQTLKSLGKYTESDHWMQKFNTAKANDNRAVKFASNKDYQNKIKENSGRYDIKNLPINSSVSDFAPSFRGNDLVFSSARDTGRITRNIHKWNNRPFTNLYRSVPNENGDFIDVEKLSKTLNKKTHESSTAFTKDGKTVYFTRNNSENGKFARDKQGLSRLKIYRATLKDGEWKDIIELPFNDDGYSVAHPTLSTDEKKLYFASDMSLSLGQSDIFVVDVHSDGSFGIPKNLGDKINTEGRETFPFVAENNVLYFASDGHPGLGGLDVFATKIDDMDNLYIVNVGEPVNGKQDDFSFIMNGHTKKGFFASNREGGLGSDDIYSFTENKEIDLSCNTAVSGIIKDKDTNELIAGANIIIIDSNNQTVSDIVSSLDGMFVQEGSCKDGGYKVVVSKDGYVVEEFMFIVVNANDTSGIEITLEKTIKRATVGTELIAFLQVAPVYFDLNKSSIRTDAQATLQKVIGYLSQFPELKIEVQSHTDAKASNAYNQKLSERRAKATVAYLIANGIDRNRVTGQGFGESRLANDCTTREKCTDSEHQANRRSEFIVVD